MFIQRWTARHQGISPRRRRKSLRTAPAATVLAAIAIVAPAVLAASIAAAAAPREERQAAELVRQGLEAEVDGNLPERKRALAEAAKLAPDYAPALWNQGFVQRDGKWVNFAQSHIPPGDLAVLEVYRRLRGAYADRADSQLELADWCHRRGLKDQEHAHLSRSLELNPNQPALRARMGMALVDGNWLSRQEVREARERGRRAVDDLRHWTPRCEKMRSAVERSSGRQQDAVLEPIRSLRDRAAIMALETIVAPASDDAGLAVVEALAEMNRPEADIALARLASFSSSEEVADGAKASLKKRPLYNFVPAMLGSLVAPTDEQTTIVYDYRYGRMLFRQTIMREGVDRKQLAVFDNAYEFYTFVRTPVGIFEPRRSGGLGEEQLIASELGSATAAGRSRVINAEHRQFERVNGLICTALRDVTGQKLKADPREWWKWWNDLTETIVLGEKPLDVVYAEENLTLLSPQPIHCACLVAGTPIWTDRGAVAVDKMQIGDRVLAQDPDTGELAYKLVLRTTVREHSGTIAIGLPGGEQIVASGGHPFWVAGRGWVNARHLKAGMLLHGVDGGAEIESIEIDDDANQTVYNLVVEEFHDYFAGEGHLLLHDITPRGPTRGPLPGLEADPLRTAQSAVR